MSSFGLLNQDSEAKDSLPLQVWVDESGGKNQGALVIAGLIGRSEDWARFTSLWAAELSRRPAIKVFKMGHAAGLSGEFHPFSAEMRDRKVRDLARIIDQFGFRRFHVGFDMQGFSETLEKRSTRPLNLPYSHAFKYAILAATLDIADRHPEQRFEIFFDRYDHNKGISDWYPMVWIMVEEQFPELLRFLPTAPSFREDLEFMPLQAADMMAGLCRGRIVAQPQPFQFDWVEDELRNTPMSQHATVFDREELHEINAELGQPRSLDQIPITRLRKLKAFYEQLPKRN